MGVDMDKMKRSKKRETKRASKSIDWTDFACYDGDDDLVGFAHEGRLVHETDAAILIVHEGEKVWLPKSQIGDGDDEVLMITAWFADKEGLDVW